MDDVWADPMTGAEVQKKLNLSERQVARLAAYGLLSTRVHPRLGRRIFRRDQVEEMAAERENRPTAEMRARVKARALWRLATKYRVDYCRFFAEELAKERGSPAGTGNPPTSKPIPVQRKGA